MHRYNVIEKIHKTLYCTYYSALQKATLAKVLLQKQRSPTSLQPIRGTPFCPRVLDRFEEEGKRFVVFEDIGSSLSIAMANHAIGNRLKYHLIKALIDIAVSLNEQGTPLAMVSPELFFLKIDRLYLVEFPSDCEPPLRYQSPEGLRGWPSEISTIFSLGCILTEIVL